MDSANIRAITKIPLPLLLLCCCLVLPASLILAAPPSSVRFVSFNCSLNRTDLGTPLPTALANPSFTKVRQVAEIIQRLQPDVLLLNEFDFNDANPDQSPALFQTNFLAVAQNGQTPITYPYRFTAIVNTGYPTNQDLNRSGVIDTSPGDDAYGQDCFGYGRWPGQYGMVIYSKFPIQTAAVRTFRNFLWKNMPGALLPDDAATTTIPADYYSTAIKNLFRLSSKSHWDVPINIDGHTVHLLVHHPTPPVFDGTEDRNGRRNHDEIRLWADYISPGKSGYITDDNGVTGGLAAGERFVIMGDHNADPFKGDSYNVAIKQLLDHPLVNSKFSPVRSGMSTPVGQPFGSGYYNNSAYDTADFLLRVDYVLPSNQGMKVLSGGIFWPATSDVALTNLIAVSDHRAVHFDLALTPIPEVVVQGLAVTLVNGNAQLQWQGRAGYQYQIQFAESLNGPWLETPEIPITLHPNTFAATATDVNPAAGRRFYRVKITFQ
jgi:3-phytase